MKEYGLVVGLNKNFAQVRIGRNSACASCGKCGMTENQKHVDFFAENTLDAQVGDTVELDIPETNSTYQLALVAYILPLVPALILLFIALANWTDWLAILLFFVGYAVGFAVVCAIDKAKHHNWVEMPKMVQIVQKTHSTQNKE